MFYKTRINDNNVESDFVNDDCTVQLYMYTDDNIMSMNTISEILSWFPFLNDNIL